jgi:hypothetical protein
MFIKEKNYGNYIVKVKIEIGKELGLTEANEAYVELKELPTIETMELKDSYGKGEVELLNYFKKTLPICIIDHNLYVTESQKMGNEEVTALIFEKTGLATKVIGDFIEKCFFIQTKKKGAK